MYRVGWLWACSLVLCPVRPVVELADLNRSLFFSAFVYANGSTCCVLCVTSRLCHPLFGVAHWRGFDIGFFPRGFRPSVSSVYALSWSSFCLSWRVWNEVSRGRHGVMDGWLSVRQPLSPLGSGSDRCWGFWMSSGSIGLPNRWPMRPNLIWPPKLPIFCCRCWALKSVK